MNVAILGATGAVGREMMKILAERSFPVEELRLLASPRSAGQKLLWQGRELTVQPAEDSAFEGMDIVLGAAENDIAKRFAPAIVKAGAVFVDNSSAFRMDPEVPLVVPEVNPEALRQHKGIIANPNCSTIIMMMALKPIYDLSKIKRIVVSTYQAVSGAGKEAIDELTDQVKAYLADKPMEASILPSASLPKHYPIAFNLIPQIDVFLDNGYTKEEMKMVNETHKIFNDYSIGITATTIRVPVFRSHSESINIELETPVSLDDMRAALAKFPGVQVQDAPEDMVYPMPLYTSTQNDVYVGRIREDHSQKNCYNLWVVGDQIRKGAALNALQIAETMLRDGLV